MQPAIDNFILYGSETLVRERRYLDLLLDMYEKTMASNNLGAHDRVHAMKIADALLLSLRGQCDSIMPRLLAPAVSFITRENTDEEPLITTHLYLHAIQLVVHALTCNPLLTIAYLDHAGATQTFLSKWYARLDDFSRLHDRKLAIFAIAAVIEALPTASPAVAQIAAGLLGGALQIFRKIPEAIAARRKLETEMGETSSSEEGDGAPAGKRDDKYEYIGDDEDIHDSDADYEAYLKRLAVRSFGGSSLADGIRSRTGRMATARRSRAATRRGPRSASSSLRSTASTRTRASCRSSPVRPLATGRH